MSDDREGGPSPDGRRPALIALAIIAVLVVAGYFLATALREEGRREDCLMSGRHNCAPIDLPRKD